MKDSTSLHERVQSHIDCFGDSDPLSEMSLVQNDSDASEAAIKWLALAALHGITAGAQKIVLKHNKEGRTKVTAIYREAALPDPGDAVGGRIVDTLREITHLDQPKGALPLALGVRDSSIELRVKIKTGDHGQKVTLEFPAL